LPWAHGVLIAPLGAGGCPGTRGRRVGVRMMLLGVPCFVDLEKLLRNRWAAGGARPEGGHLERHREATVRARAGILVEIHPGLRRGLLTILQTIDFPTLRPINHHRSMYSGLYVDHPVHL
jgi:hypothetical protein